MGGKKDGLSRKEFLASFGKGLLGVAVAGGAGAAGAAPEPEAALPLRLVEKGTLAPGLAQPLGVAYDARDRLYVAGDPGVKIFDARGQAAGELKTAGPAACVAVDPEGFVYAAGRARIEKFDPAGKPVAAWGEQGEGDGQFRHLTGLAADERYVYVTDAGSRKLLRFAVDGEFIDAIDGPGLAGEAPNFHIPSLFFDCALAPRGGLWVGHTGRHRLELYDANMELERHWGTFGPGIADFCGCCNPTNLAVLPDGRFATTEKGVPRLKIYSAEGKLEACLGEKHFPGNAAGMDLAVNAAGLLALVEPVSKTIRFFEVRG